MNRPLLRAGDFHPGALPQGRRQSAALRPNHLDPRRGSAAPARIVPTGQHLAMAMRGGGNRIWNDVRGMLRQMFRIVR